MESLREVLQVIIGEAQHLDNGAEEQDVAVQVDLHLVAVVLHWDDAGNGHANQVAQTLYLRRRRRIQDYF